MRPVGAITRGTTNPGRLRRVDNWLTWRHAAMLRALPDPHIVDLGFGATPITTIELAARLRTAVGRRVRVTGLEIDAVRVEHARPAADPPWLRFDRGGFELAGLRPTLVRAMNVLRQYNESEVDSAWAAMTSGGAILVEGTCDELGRLASWVEVTASGPRSLTLAAKLSTLDTPATLAERLPKALIHHNVPGEPIHALLTDLDHAWQVAAPHAVQGPRRRWIAALEQVRSRGWPLGAPARWRHGELTVPWARVAPA